MKPGKFFTNASSPGRLLPFVAGIAVISLIFFVYHILTWPIFKSIIKSVVRWEQLFSDFVIYYYPMGEAIFTTGLPVEGFLYSPFIAIVLAVFPPLGLSASLVLWGILQLLSLFLYIYLFRRLVPAGLPIQLFFVVLLLTSFPILLNFMGGQVSVFMIVALLGTLVLYEQGRHSAAAGSLTIAASFKFFPIIFLAPFAARRDTRFLLFVAATCFTFLFLIPYLLLGAGDTLRFYGGLLDSFRESDWVTKSPHSHYFPHVALRLFGAMGLDLKANLPLLGWISYGIAALNMGLIYVINRARLQHALVCSFQVVFLTIPFVLKTSWPHDFVFLSFTQAFLAWWLLETKKRGVSLFLLIVSIILSNIIFFTLLGNFLSYSFLALLFWANLLLLIALYLELLPLVLKQTRKSPSQV